MPFFVKNGDGAADIKPIAHLYKTQIYHLAGYPDVPGEIRRRPPTTDTYSLEQSQDEFFFSLPYEQLDMALYAHDHAITPADASPQMGLEEEQVGRIFGMIDSRRRAAKYLALPPVLLNQE